MARSIRRFGLTFFGLGLLLAGGIRVVLVGSLAVLGLFSRALLTGLTLAAALAVFAAVRASAKRRLGAPRRGRPLVRA